MQHAGKPSWEFAESDATTVHGVLYVRDALHLEIDGEPANPPPLQGSVPDRSGLLEPATRLAAARQWPSWWRAMVARETGPRPDLTEYSILDGSAREAWLRAARDRIAASGSPPEFTGLSDRPELRLAAQATYQEGCAWVDATGPALDPAADRSTFVWAVVKETAEDVAFDRDVAIDAVRGYALVLTVEGEWWHPFAPGIVCCSRAAAADPRTGRVILRTAFESNLAGH